MNTAAHIFSPGKKEERERTGLLWQVKEPLTRFTPASDEAETAAGQQEPKKHGSETRKTAHFAGRCSPVIKDKMMDIARQQGWTESKVFATAAEQFVENNIGLKLGAHLASTVQDAITKTMQSFKIDIMGVLISDLYISKETKLYMLELFRARLSPNQLHELQNKIHNLARNKK